MNKRKGKPGVDDYDNVPHMIPRKIVNPLIDAEVVEISQNLRIAMFLVENRVRLPDDLVIALGKLEKRFFAAADEGLMLQLVDAATEAGLSKNHPGSYSGTAWEVAGKKLGMDPTTLMNKFYEVSGAVKRGEPRDPLPSTPKAPKRSK